MSHDHSCQQECEGCPFRGPKVGSKGNPKAEIVIVAESPGNKEVRQGIPLVGPAGKIFHTHVPDDDSVYILNAIECSPGRSKDDKKMAVATQCCHARLLEQIEAHPRKVIIAMGNAAIRSVMGDDSLKITQVRGKLYPSPLAEMGVMPVIHTAALMRGTGSYRQWQEDIEYALHLGRGGDPYDYIKSDWIVLDRDCEDFEVHAAMVGMLGESRDLTCDTETSDLYWSDGNYILNFGIGNGTIYEPDAEHKNPWMKSYVFHVEHLAALKEYFEEPTIKWCWHNGKFDVKWFHEQGIKARCDDDTMLMSYALDETSGVHGLETLANDILKAPDYKYMVQPYLPNKKTSYSVIPDEVLDEYLSIDVGNTAQLRPILRDRVRQQPDLEKLYTQTLMPASTMLTQVEHNGFHIDVERLDENDIYFAKVLEESNAVINELVGHSINPGSPKQMKEVLFGQFKFPNLKNGSTAKEVIAKLIEKTDGHPILMALQKHRVAVKMHGTYVKGIRRWIREDGRIHPTFKIHNTKTGRLAASEPNSQNPPRLPQIRGQFVAKPGYELIECDLSQAELRTLAVLSKCPVLMGVYLRGEDLHTDLACVLFPQYLEFAASDDPVKKAQAKEWRVKCKNVNFGIIYGITKFGLFEQIGGSIKECAWLIAGWYDRYQVAGEFIAKCRAAPRNNQVITTMFGRKKRVGIVSPQNIMFLQNEAANFPPQSIASDITLHAAINTWEQLLKWDIRIVNLVHDSIIMECPITPENVVRHKAVKLVVSQLEDVPKQWGMDSIPFVADAEVGHRWGYLVDYQKLGDKVLTV